MKTYGLIGYPLSHSFSEGYFRDKFSRENIIDCTYINFSLPDIIMLPKLIASEPALRGVNVTIPHKLAVIPLLTRLDPEAEAIGAVNCIRIEEDLSLTGYNTDAYGFRRSLLMLLGEARPEALVLGSGGASRAVSYVLRELGVAHRIVSRSGCAGASKDAAIGYGELTPQVVAEHKLIINCTPLGTYPATDSLPPIPYDFITSQHFLYDLVYNPPMTRFLEEGAKRGAEVMNGQSMLEYQADKSWEIWNRNAGISG